MDSEVLRTTVSSLTHVGLMVLGAIVLLIIGRWLIGFGVRLITRALEKLELHSFDSLFGILLFAG